MPEFRNGIVNHESEGGMFALRSRFARQQFGFLPSTVKRVAAEKTAIMIVEPEAVRLARADISLRIA